MKRYSAKQLSENLAEILNEAYHGGEPFLINLDGQDILLGNHNQVEEFKQFDVWTADLPSRKGGHVISGRRPVIIVSNDEGNLENPMVTIVPLTSKLEYRQLPTHALVRGCGLRCTSRALCEQILTMDKSRLRKRIGRVEDSFVHLSIQHALAEQFTLN